jgi:hypothetical protein
MTEETPRKTPACKLQAIATSVIRAILINLIFIKVSG